MAKETDYLVYKPLLDGGKPVNRCPKKGEWLRGSDGNMYCAGHDFIMAYPIYTRVTDGAVMEKCGREEATHYKFESGGIVPADMFVRPPGDVVGFLKITAITTPPPEASRRQRAIEAAIERSVQADQCTHAYRTRQIIEAYEAALSKEPA